MITWTYVRSELESEKNKNKTTSLPIHNINETLHTRTYHISARRLRDLLTIEQYLYVVRTFFTAILILYKFLVSRLCHDIMRAVRHAPHFSTLNEDTNTTSVLISQFAQFAN